MEDTKPHQLTPAELKEIMTFPPIREMWGIEDEMTPVEFESIIYAARFNYFSGGPGYVGDLFILQGDVLGHCCPAIR
jgi:hypothetical protein